MNSSIAERGHPIATLACYQKILESFDVLFAEALEKKYLEKMESVASIATTTETPAPATTTAMTATDIAVASGILPPGTTAVAPAEVPSWMPTGGIYVRLPDWAQHYDYRDS